MQERKNSFTKSLFIGLWDLLNFIRKLFFNLVFILIVVLIFSVLTKEEQQTPGWGIGCASGQCADHATGTREDPIAIDYPAGA